MKRLMSAIVLCGICIVMVSCKSWEEKLIEEHFMMNTIEHDVNYEQLYIAVYNKYNFEFRDKLTDEEKAINSGVAAENPTVSIELDNKFIGTFQANSFMTIPVIAKGDHIIRLTAKTYKPVEKNIYILGFPQVQKIQLELEKE
jgi:hypothetical protein